MDKSSITNKYASIFFNTISVSKPLNKNSRKRIYNYILLT